MQAISRRFGHYRRILINGLLLRKVKIEIGSLGECLKASAGGRG
jgi:hypothetical protein